MIPGLGLRQGSSHMMNIGYVLTDNWRNDRCNPVLDLIHLPATFVIPAVPIQPLSLSFLQCDRLQCFVVWLSSAEDDWKQPLCGSAGIAN